MGQCFRLISHQQHSSFLITVHVEIVTAPFYPFSTPALHASNEFVYRSMDVSFTLCTWIRSHRVFEGLLLPQLTLSKYRVWALRSLINFTLLHKTVCLLTAYHTTMRTQRLATTLP